MSYFYYPGCSLKSTGRAYEESFLAVMDRLGQPLQELDDWNCCGATAYMAVDELKAYALAARNLAMAEKIDAQAGKNDPQVIAPCNACYLTLNKAAHYLAAKNGKSKQIREALDSVNLHYAGKVQVRHPLDLLINDIGLERVKASVSNPLEGLKVACYYGCQIVRPYATFDDQRHPMVMDRLMQAVGAEPLVWPLKTRCCGGSLIGTVETVGMRLSYILLREAIKRGAEAIVTICPLCQFNLECYQEQMSAQFEEPVNIPIVYFTQLMGLAYGIPETELGLQRLFVPLKPAMAAH